MSEEARVKLDASWMAQVGEQFATPRMQALAQFLRAEKAAGKVIYPPGRQIFAALDATPFENVKVVILGQDPYHGPGQAHGLCFSVLPGVPVPPSLENIFKEIERDLGIPRPDHGYLMPWARQGVLLLNAVLTVERGRAGSQVLLEARFERLQRYRRCRSSLEVKAWRNLVDAVEHPPPAAALLAIQFLRQAGEIHSSGRPAAGCRPPAGRTSSSTAPPPTRTSSSRTTRAAIGSRSRGSSPTPRCSSPSSARRSRGS